MKVFDVDVSISHVRSVPSLHVVQRTISIKVCNHSVPWPGFEPRISRIRRNTIRSAEVSDKSSVEISMDIKDSFLEIKRPGYEADCSSLTSTEVRNVWSYTSILPHVLIA
jgi:hypothetical protein